MLKWEFRHGIRGNERIWAKSQSRKRSCFFRPSRAASTLFPLYLKIFQLRSKHALTFWWHKCFSKQLPNVQLQQIRYSMDCFICQLLSKPLWGQICLREAIPFFISQDIMLSILYPICCSWRFGSCFKVLFCDLGVTASLLHSKRERGSECQFT